MTIHHLEPQRYYYTFAPHPPALRIRSGDMVIAETMDALGYDAHGQPAPQAMKHRVSGTSLRESNPTVGPIYVEEAAEGDLLAVQIQRIRLTRDVATSAQSAHFGSLTGEVPGLALLYNDPVADLHYEWQLDLERNVGTLELPNSRLGRAEVSLAPFIGTIGVAPRYGRAETTLTPGEYGGNMDCADVCEGATLYLPVWADGAYLAYGDVHAAQGDGELIGTALEVPAEITLQIEVLKGRAAQWPRLENQTDIAAIGSTRPLMNCLRLASLELLAWLVDDYGFDRAEAWQLMSQVVTLRVGNVVDPNYSVVARFPKAYLP
jgi:amidase